MQNSVAQYNMNLGSAIPYQFPMTMNVPMGMPFQLVAGTTQLDQNTGGNVGVTSKTQTSSQVATTTTGGKVRGGGFYGWSWNSSF